MDRLYVGRLIEYIGGRHNIQEIPKQQRYLNQPGLNELFWNKEKRNKRPPLLTCIIIVESFLKTVETGKEAVP